MGQSPRSQEEWEQNTERDRHLLGLIKRKKKKMGEYIENTDFWKRMAFSLNKERKEKLRFLTSWPSGGINAS